MYGFLAVKALIPNFHAPDTTALVTFHAVPTKLVAPSNAPPTIDPMVLSTPPPTLRR